MQLFSNNFKTTLAVAVDNAATSITVVSAAGLPVLSGGNTTLVTLESANRVVVEIVEVTAVVGNVLTVARGREGTVASSFDAGSFVEGRLTAGWLNDTTQELVTVDTKIDALTASVANLATAQSAIQSSGTMTLTTAPTQMAFTVTTPSTDNTVMTLDDAANTFTFLHNASFNWVSNLVLSSSTGLARTITFRLVNTANNAVLTTQSVTLEIQSGRTITLPVNTLLTVGRNGAPVAPLTVRVEAFADATGYAIDSFSSTLASGSSYDVNVIDRLDELTDVVIALPQAGEVLRFNGTDWVNDDLSDKADVASLATVATSGSYNDLSDKPTIPTVPTNVSEFTNDAGYITGVTRYLNAILSDASTAITNATGYITPVELPVSGTITSIRARTATGTCSVQFKRNGVALGTSISATTSGVSQTVSQSVVAGDLITVDTSSASGNGLTISVEIN